MTRSHFVQSELLALAVMVTLALAGCTKEDKSQQPGASLPLMGDTVVASAPAVTTSTTTVTTSTSTPTAVRGAAASNTAASKSTIKNQTASKPASAPAIPTPLLDEINTLRRNPSLYASYVDQQGHGTAAAREAAAELRRTSPMSALAVDGRLNSSAQAHVNDIGPRGLLSHNSTNGQSMASRLWRYVPGARMIAENMAFGQRTEREVVLAWVIDEGISSRGHRKNLLNRALNSGGTACGYHAKYRTMCVSDFAQE